jgi:hypothetical protein
VRKIQRCGSFWVIRKNHVFRWGQFTAFFYHAFLAACPKNRHAAVIQTVNNTGAAVFDLKGVFFTGDDACNVAVDTRYFDDAVSGWNLDGSLKPNTQELFQSVKG